MRHANAEVQVALDALNEVDKGPTPKRRRGTLPPLTQPLAERGRPPPVDQGRVALDDIGAMLKEVNRLYSEAKPTAGAPPAPAKKEEPKKEEAAKAKPRRQKTEPRAPPANGA